MTPVWTAGGVADQPNKTWDACSAIVVSGRNWKSKEVILKTRIHEVADGLAKLLTQILATDVVTENHPFLEIYVCFWTRISIQRREDAVG